MKKIIGIVFVIVILAVAGYGIWYFEQQQGNNQNSNQNQTIQSPEPTAKANYACNEGKTISAAFYKGEQKPVEPGQMPTPSGTVKVTLSDGRNFNLPQTISADGSRYANSDESFVFWSKGNGALVLENNKEKNYIGCVAVADNPGNLPKVYSDGTAGFSIRYPADFTAVKTAKGVMLAIPASLAAGTNLSSADTGVSVEIIPASQTCDAKMFLKGYSNVQLQTKTENGIDYSFAAVSQGAAGNFYEEDIYAIPETNPCIGIHYLIHSTNIANYPAGTVTAFDKDALLKVFDNIRNSLTY